jgi:small subunit ribosomal protein S12
MTFNQAVRHQRKHHLRKYNRSPKMSYCPQKTGICLRVGTTKPKKPNSAVRKIAKVRLHTGYNVRAVIPGAGFHLQEHNTVLLRAGRVRDIPGIHYRLIRNKLDLGPPLSFQRQQRRSKFGVTNWVYLIRTPAGEPWSVVSRVRSKRQHHQAEWGLPVTWAKTGSRIRTQYVPPRTENESNK